MWVAQVAVYMCGWNNMILVGQSSLPSEEFELTANSLGAHIETHCGLILRTLGYLTVNSQDDSLCELAVSFATHTVSLL